MRPFAYMLLAACYATVMILRPPHKNHPQVWPGYAFECVGVAILISLTLNGFEP